MNHRQEYAHPDEAETSGVSRFPSQTAAPVPWTRCAFLSLVAFFLVAVGYSTVFRAAWNDIERTDLSVYSAAGQAVLDGTDIYQAHNTRGWFYVYPPVFAVFMVPLAKLSPAWGSGLWYAVSLLGLAAALVMAVRLARASAPDSGGENDTWTLYEWPAFIASPWLLSGLLRCQASAFMVVLMIAAVYCHWRGRHWLGGMSLAAAALIKAFPIALLAYYAWRRQWRFIGGVCLGLVLGGLLLPAPVFGWQKNLDYWQQWGKLVAGPALASQQQAAVQTNPLFEQLLDAQKPRNQSLEALLLTLKVPPSQTKPVLAGLALVMLAAMAWAGRKADAMTEILLVSAFATWNLLIPPISESHYFGLMLLPLAILTAVALGEDDRLSSRWAWLTLFLFFVATLWSNIDPRMHLYRFLTWATLAVWWCLLWLAHRRAARAAMDFSQ